MRSGMISPQFLVSASLALNQWTELPSPGAVSIAWAFDREPERLCTERALDTWQTRREPLAVFTRRSATSHTQHEGQTWPHVPIIDHVI